MTQSIDFNSIRVDFQGHLVKLSDLDASKSLHEYLSVDDLGSNSRIKVGKELKKRDFLQDIEIVERKFNVKKTVKWGDNNAESDASMMKDASEAKFSTRMNVFDLIDEASENKTMIISGVAGEGKSTFLMEIARLLKKTSPTSWVSFVDLKQHVQSFKTYNENLTFPEFISNNILKLEKAFEQKLFDQLYQKGKVFILMDGFDELSSIYKKPVLSLVKSFDVDSDNQLWITTRSHLRKELEIALDQESVSFLPFSQQDQINFLVNFWRSKKDFNENKRKIAENLVSNLTEDFKKGRSDLIGLPLTLRVIAEIYEDNLASLDFLLIFKAFIEKMLMKSFTNIGDLSIQETSLLTDSKSISHHQLALNYYFGSQEPSDNELPSEEVLRFGIIHVDDFGKVSFAHETFAEYFVAEFVILCLKQKLNLEKVSTILLDVLTSKRFHILRMFINKELIDANIEEESLYEELAGFMANQGEDENLQKLLHCSLEEGLEKLTEFIFLVIKSFEDAEVMNSCLKSKTEYDETILTLAIAGKSFEMLKRTWSFLFVKLSRWELKEMCLNKSKNNVNLLLSIVSNHENEDSLKFMLEKLQKFFNLDEIMKFFMEKDDNEMNVLCKATTFVKNSKNTICLLTFAKTLFHEEEFNGLLNEMDIYGNNFLLIAFRSTDKVFVESLWKIAETLINEDQLKILLRSTNKSKEGIFLIAARNCKPGDVFRTLWKILNEIFDLEEIVTMLEQKDNYNNSVLNVRLFRGNPFSLNGLIWIFEKCYDPKQLKLVVMEQQNIYKRSALCVIAKQNSNWQLLDSFWNFSCSILTRDELKVLLHFVDSKSRNILHLASQQNTKTIVEMLLKYVKSILTPDEQQKFFRELNKNGENIFHCAAWNFINNDIFSTLFRTLIEVLSKQEIMTMLKMEDTKSKLNVFHTIIKRNHAKRIEEFLTFLNAFSIEDQKSLLLEKEKQLGKNVLSIVAQSKKSKKVKEILSNYAYNVLSTDEQNDFFSGSNEDFTIH